jgi:methyl-accepting chemotaxis protein
VAALSNLSIGKKIYGLIGFVFILAGVVSGVLAYFLEATDTRYSILLARSTPALVEEMRIRGDLQNIGRQMDNVLLLEHPPEGLPALEQSIADLFAGIERSLTIIQQASRGAVAGVANDVATAVPEMQRAAAATVAVKRSGDPDQDAKARRAWATPNGRPLVVSLYDRIAAAADQDLRHITDLTDEYSSQSDRTTKGSMLVMAAGLIAAAVLAFIVTTLGIARPLGALRGAMRRLADGDLDVAVPNRTRKDEIGAMAGAVQVFKDNALRARAHAGPPRTNGSAATQRWRQRRKPRPWWSAR